MRMFIRALVREDVPFYRRVTMAMMLGSPPKLLLDLLSWISSLTSCWNVLRVNSRRRWLVIIYLLKNSLSLCSERRQDEPGCRTLLIDGQPANVNEYNDYTFIFMWKSTARVDVLTFSRAPWSPVGVLRVSKLKNFPLVQLLWSGPNKMFLLFFGAVRFHICGKLQLKVDQPLDTCDQC